MELVALSEVESGKVVILHDLIDGERRDTYYLRGNDSDAIDPVLQRPELWVRAERIGFIQWREDGSMKVKQRGCGKMWYADRNIRVEVTDGWTWLDAVALVDASQ